LLIHIRLVFLSYKYTTNQEMYFTGSNPGNACYKIIV